MFAFWDDLSIATVVNICAQPFQHLTAHAPAVHDEVISSFPSLFPVRLPYQYLSIQLLCHERKGGGRLLMHQAIPVLGLLPSPFSVYMVSWLSLPQLLG